MLDVFLAICAGIFAIFTALFFGATAYVSLCEHFSKPKLLKDKRVQALEANLAELTEENKRLFDENQRLLSYVTQKDTEKQELQKELNIIKIKFNELSQKHSEIRRSFTKNLHLFYSNTPEFKRLYSKLDAKKLFRAFDPTLTFYSAEYIIAHSDNTGDKYRTTLFSCTCPDFDITLKKMAPCKHMVFLAYNLGNMFYYKEQAKKYFKEDVAFLAEKEFVEKELKKKRKQLRDIKKKSPPPQ